MNPTILIKSVPTQIYGLNKEKVEFAIHPIAYRFAKFTGPETAKISLSIQKFGMQDKIKIAGDDNATLLDGMSSRLNVAPLTT